ncbi:MAG: hypothetical protein AAGI91_05385 [Bacteroidota bacterium]
MKPEPTHRASPITARPYLVVAAVYAAVCLALWPVPLLGLLHAESSAVVAGVAFFASGLAALALFRRGDDLWPVLLRLEGLLAVPWALLTVSLLWRPNCGYAQGFGLFLLFAVPSVALAVALVFALDAVGWRRRALWFVLVGLGVAALPVVWDLGLHPQFYTYNHVWGGVLGPIYDEELAVRPGLFWFRGLTLLWVVALVLLGRRAEERRNGRAEDGQVRRGGRSSPLPLFRSSKPEAWALLAVAVLIGLAYAFSPLLGFNTTGEVIRARLGSHLATERFDIYYDAAAISPGELQVIADAHAVQYDRLRRALGVEVPERIATYLYPNARTKGALTGAAQTSVAPVWLPRPQMHLLVGRFEASFAHELVHVFSREFGGILRASPAVGLVEGLAVAFEPPDGVPSPDAQVIAAARYGAGLGAEPLGRALASRLSPLGFWTGRGAVSYTTTGSFVADLYRRYGADPLRQVYASGDFERVYGLPLDTLAARWAARLDTLPDDPEATALVARRFTRPSLFERRCPHWVEPWLRAYRAGASALAAGEVDEALQQFEQSIEVDPAQPWPLAAWGRVLLARGETDRVTERLGAAVAAADTLASPLLLSRLGDAYRLAGSRAEANAVYRRAWDETPVYRREARARLRLRRDLSADALRTLLTLDPSGVRAERLAEQAAPAAKLMAGLLWADARDYAAAQTILNDAELSDVEPERLAWAGRFAHAAGDRLAAAALAGEAASAYDALGAVHAAARQRDYADALWWLLLREDPVLSAPG